MSVYDRRSTQVEVKRTVSAKELPGTGKDKDLLWTTYVLMEFQGIMSRKSTEGVR